MATTQEAIDEMVAEVTALEGVVPSALAALDFFATAFEQAKDDPEEIVALVGRMRTQRESIANGIAAHPVPAAPENPTE